MTASRIAHARALGDAVLMEGYALYPFRASAPKNRYRWAFGVLAPRAWSEVGGCEPWWLEAEVLVAGAPTRLEGQLRLFQIDRRTVEDDAGRPVPALERGGERVVAWDEGRLHEIAFEVTGAPHQKQRFALAGERRVEAVPGGRIVHERRALDGLLQIAVEPVAASRPLVRVSIRVENVTPWAERDAPREQAIAAAFASTHLVIGVEDGELISLLDPPDWAHDAAAGCRNTRTFPVLVGPPGAHDVMLAAPIILYDHAQLAPESPGDMCDATEIDELLALRTLTLTDDEKRQARATDARAAAIVDRVEALPDEWLGRLHGAARELHAGEMVPHGTAPLAPGRKVRLRAPARGTDAQDLLYAGHVATIAELRHDVDGTVFLCVTIDDDPAAELHDWYGRYHYYRPDEVEPL